MTAAEGTRRIFMQALPVGKAGAAIGQVIDSLPACVAYIDQSLHLGFVNRACAEWIGGTVKELEKRHIAEILDRGELGCAYPIIQRALAGCKQKYEGKFIRAGSPVSIVACFCPHRGADGKVLGIFVFVEHLDAIQTHPQKKNKHSAHQLTDAAERNHQLVQSNLKLHKEIATLRRATAVLDSEKQIMEMICSGINLQSVLEKLCESIERFSHGGRCSILVADKAEHQLLRDVTSSLPASFAKAIREVPRTSDIACHGPVAFLDRQVYIEDVASDPQWSNYRKVALAHDIRSVWLTPILSTSGLVFGTLVLYYRTPPDAPQADLALIRRTSHLAATALQHNQAERQLNYLATHDALTGLPNRHMFNLILERVIAKARRASGTFALLFIDLDRFKPVNDQFGHESGDQLLKQVAERLTRTVRQQDTISRLGGDEFTIIIEDVNQVGKIAEKLRTVFSSPFLAGPGGGPELCMSCSIGVALYPQHGVDADTLIRNADTAMYQAKNLGGDTCQVFAPLLDRIPLARINTEG